MGNESSPGTQKTKSCARAGIQTAEFLPLESWRLPSGQKLAEFALEEGFLASALLAQKVSRPAATGQDAKAEGNLKQAPRREKAGE